MKPCKEKEAPWRKVTTEIPASNSACRDFLIYLYVGLETEVCLDSLYLLLCLCYCAWIAVCASHLALDLCVELNLRLCT